MRAWLEKNKPAASRQTHLLLAAAMWTVVGAALLLVGLRWVEQSALVHRLLWIAIAMGAGAAKAHWVLRRTARRIVTRIRVRGDGKCLGGFLSVGSWLLVVGMIAGGRWLRTSNILPRYVVGLLYAGVGTALLVASQTAWRMWADNRRSADSSDP